MVKFSGSSSEASNSLSNSILLFFLDTWRFSISDSFELWRYISEIMQPNRPMTTKRHRSKSLNVWFVSVIVFPIHSLQGSGLNNSFLPLDLKVAVNSIYDLGWLKLDSSTLLVKRTCCFSNICQVGNVHIVLAISAMWNLTYLNIQSALGLETTLRQRGRDC